MLISKKKEKMVEDLKGLRAMTEAAKVCSIAILEFGKAMTRLSKLLKDKQKKEIT